jgi:hypothetical protein
MMKHKRVLQILIKLNFWNVVPNNMNYLDKRHLPIYKRLTLFTIFHFQENTYTEHVNFMHNFKMTIRQ